MRRTVIAIFVCLSLFLVAPLFAGGTKEEGPSTGGASKPADTSQPTSKEAQVAAQAIKSAVFPGVDEISYAAWDIGKTGGSLVISQISDPKSFNSCIAAETSTTDIMNRVNEAVVDRDPLTLEWIPMLVEKWETAKDNLSAVFTMRKNLKWSDGEPLTAEDVVYTVNELIYNEKVKTNFRDGFRVGDALAKIELIDTNTFKVTLPSLYAGLLNMMNFPPMPKHIFEPLVKEKGIEAVNSFWGVDTDVTKVVGSGPFLLKQYVPSQKIVLKRNPNYWMKDAKGQQYPYLDEVTILIVESQDTQSLKFLAGETDYYGLRGADVATFIPKKQELKFGLYNGGPAAGTNFLVLNENPKGVKDPAKLAWFNDRRFRLALAHLIDKETIINNIQFGFGFPQDSFIPVFSPYYWKDAPKLAPKYDPAAAKKILDEMDLTDRNNDGVREDAKGNKVAFVLITNTGNSERIAIGESIAQEAKKVGIDVTFKPGDFNAMVNSLQNTFDWEGIIIGLTGSVDPISGANVYPSNGNLHMVEPKQESPRRDWEKEVDKWWDYANLTLDESKRKEGFMNLQKIWLEQLPWIYTTNPAAIYAVRGTVGNAKPRPVLRGGFGILQYLYLK